MICNYFPLSNESLPLYLTLSNMTHLHLNKWDIRVFSFGSLLHIGREPKKSNKFSPLAKGKIFSIARKGKIFSIARRQSVLISSTQSWSFSHVTTFVIIFAGFLLVWIVFNLKCCSSTSLGNQWYLTSMCFVPYNSKQNSWSRFSESWTLFCLFSAFLFVCWWLQYYLFRDIIFVSAFLLFADLAFLFWFRLLHVLT